MLSLIWDMGIIHLIITDEKTEMNIEKGILGKLCHSPVYKQQQPLDSCVLQFMLSNCILTIVENC